MSSDIEMAAFIGLDWADQQHVIRLRAAGSAAVEAQFLDQKPESLRAWIAQLRQRFAGRPVAIALEQSRGSLLYALMSVDFLRLYPVNPQSLAKFRKAFYSSGAKDDPQDAQLLLEMLEKHRDRLRVWVPDDADTRCLRLLAESRRKLVNRRTAFTNQLTSLLKESFPQGLEWAGPLDSLRACDFLEHWPSLEALQKTSTSRLRKFYQNHTRDDDQTVQQRLDQIRQAQPLVTDPAVLAAAELMIPALVRQLRCLIESIQQFDQQLKQRFQQHDDYPLFHSFPGAGPILGPRLLSAFGSDRNRFESAAEVQNFSGIAPVTERSGKSCRVHWRLACPKFLRQSFHEFAAQSILFSQWARAFYNQLRARGSSHHAAVRALAYKWIRILFRCWKNRQPYDESVYLASLKRRGSPLHAALPSQSQEVTCG
ncbi:MAG: IS110 family transposase [Nitrospiraceae bacterium]